ncbi:hypothetical protein AZF37_09685 (plasmid) [endosymbiont 'TC1' of Trimyema compressum]|uniref:DUF1351 domain-containing protein n=1 Tax=endosymbiont 'TC1' of Trimyema compressum TaxID=243899 RepID=UPI0007F130AD|nr:DUF1351 domain-containing protein [endosymbiont 'TC1' of Trimyema compressum]AMP21445.1 hypothetical protein AZF37_09685 [endosymbiont 'TC1' of Trimyema compressum]
MDNELQLFFKKSDITYTKDKIFISNFDVLKENIETISKFIRNSEVNEKTVKEVKKILANANKTIYAIDSLKKKIKQDLLSPYLHFEGQIKELIQGIKEAEKDARSKVRDLEESERSNKKNAIEKLFNKRNQLIYKISWLTIDKFIKNEYLNKTYSMKKIEEELVVFFEKIKNDLDVLEKMTNNQFLLLNYQEHLNLALVLQDKSTQKCRRALNAFKLPCKVSISITQQIALEKITNLLEEHLFAYTIE